MLATALAADEPPLERLRALITRTITLLEEDASYRAAMELTLFKTGAAPELAPALAKKVAGLRDLRQSLADLIRAGQQRGSIRPELDPEIAATTILSLLNGVALTWLLDPEAFSPAAQAAEIANTALMGIAAPQAPGLLSECEEHSLPAAPHALAAGRGVPTKRRPGGAPARLHRAARLPQPEHRQHPRRARRRRGGRAAGGAGLPGARLRPHALLPRLPRHDHAPRRDLPARGP
nr:MAG: hypothetical protein DIU80_22675 [Chloroflexota bacterium]